MATFGKTPPPGGTQWDFFPDTKVVSHHIAPASGVITAIHVYGRWFAAGAVFRGIVYADVAGAPGALLDEGDEVAWTAGNLWRVSPNMNVPIVNGTKYWLGLHAGVQRCRIYQDAVANASEFDNNDAYVGGAEDPFGASVTEGRQYSIFATYTPAAVGAPKGSVVHKMMSMLTRRVKIPQLLPFKTPFGSTLSRQEMGIL